MVKVSVEGVRTRPSSARLFIRRSTSRAESGWYWCAVSGPMMCVSSTPNGRKASAITSAACFCLSFSPL